MPYRKDVLREDRAIGDPIFGDVSNFLHPVLYYVKDNVTLTKSTCLDSVEHLRVSDHVSHFLSSAPLSDRTSFSSDQYHHVVEDFETNWWVVINGFLLCGL